MASLSSSSPSPSPSPLQSAMLLGSPSFPNAIAWSEDNLIAVASGHLVTIIRPDLPNGPRGVIKVSQSEPRPIGFVERKDLLSGCLLSTCLYRDDKPGVKSISWSPLGMASNSGCLIAVCTTEGHVKVYRPPFCDFCAEWIEIVDVTERLYEYFQHTDFRDMGIPSLDLSKMQVEKQRSADDMPKTVSRRGHKRSKVDSGNELFLPWSSEHGNASSRPCIDMEGQRLNMVPETSSGLLTIASDHLDSVPKPKQKSLKKISENHMFPLISADQYASRSAMLCSLVVSWSPLLHVASEFFPVPNTCSSVSLLAIGGKSGKISLWRFHTPDCYTIEDRNVPTPVTFVGLLQAHNSWVTTITWLLFASDSSNLQILLATGSSDGSVKLWLGDNDKLLKSSKVDQTPFFLLKEVTTVNVVPVSVISVTVSVQHPSKMLLAIGKGSGSFEIWHCDISSSEFHMLGSYDAHEYVVWFGHLVEDFCTAVASNNSTCPSTDVFDSCFGAAVSPGNLVIATVRCFDVEKLNRMYEARILRAAIEYLWIGGLHVGVLLQSPFSFNAEEYSSFPEKELTYWGANIIWSLNQYQRLDKPLVLWDIIAALLAFKDSKSKYVEHLVIKWLSMSFMGSHTDLPSEKVLSHVSSNLSDIPSRLLHLLNIICRRVMLGELDAAQITRINSKVQNMEGVSPAIEKKITKWIEILLSSERELRERLVGFSLYAFRTSMNYPEATPSQPGYWYPVGVAQMGKWVTLEQDHVRDQLKVLASEVTQEERFLSCGYSAEEPCSYCSALVPFESPEIGFCQGENHSSGNCQRHKLSRCAVSMQVCPFSPLWFCVCCHRSTFRLPPDTLFSMSSFPVVSKKSSTKSSSQRASSKPLCPFCGILLQRQQPDFLLSPSPV